MYGAAPTPPGALENVPEIAIRPLSAAPQTVASLCEILIETVAHGGSVSFMHPLDPADASAFWQGALAAAEVISHIGARPEASLKALAREHGLLG